MFRRMRFELPTFHRVMAANSSSGFRGRPVVRSMALPRRVMSTAKEAEMGLLELYQIDSGFYQGSALLAMAVGYVYGTGEETKVNHIQKLVGAYRFCGLSAEKVSNRQLVKDYILVNSLAAVNVLAASPAFYMLFHKVHGCSLTTSFVRGLTGTVRIVPFMGAFYGAFAVLGAFATAFCVDRGMDYQTAKSTAGPALMLGGFVFLEALVELRGCGVTFAQMTPSSFLIFVPALIGRLAAGVLTQQQKVGQEPVPLLPNEWGMSEGLKKMLFDTTNTLHIDKDFFTTVIGTSVFQHILNAVTFILLTKGKATTFGDIFGYLMGGLHGSATSAAAQFGRTVMLRLGFCFTWNWCSSQKVDMPAIELAIKRIDEEDAKALAAPIGAGL